MTRPPPRPPQWLLAILSLVAGDEDRAPVAGDLLEDYALAQVPRKGRTAANLWFLRQVLSLVPSRLFEGRWPVRSLSLVSIFVILAGAWLVYMEQSLRHPGYLSRSLVDMGLVFGSLLTVTWVMRRQGFWLQSATGLYALGAGALGAWVFWHLMHGADFEGFALIIAAVLCVQAFLVFSGFVRLRRPAA